ncbi:MAG: hypothetical protein WCV88_03515 [Patescibacteria group bacterium]|jgi:hypothetical protein
MDSRRDGHEPRSRREIERAQKAEYEVAERMGLLSITSWEDEESNPDLLILQAWKKRHEVPESATTFIKLRHKILKTYEEMFMVRNWYSPGGAITHDQDHITVSQAQENYSHIMEIVGISAEEFADIFNTFLENYYVVSKQVNDIINLPETDDSLLRLEAFFKQLEEIRNKPNNKVFFLSHYWSRYRAKKT